MHDGENAIIRSFPRKRESSSFGRSRLPWVPAFAGTTGEYFAPIARP